jgi:hypothetical protein
MSLAVPQQTIPAIMGGRYLEAIAAQSYAPADGAALDLLHKVFSACIPIFDQAMQLLTNGSSFGPDLFRDCL